MMRVPDSADRAGGRPVRVEALTDGPVLRCVLRGESDFSTLDELEAALGAIELDGTRAVHLDLDRLVFADVATVRRLVGFAGAARRTGRQVRTCCAQPTLRTVLALVDVSGDLGLT